jgi:hypothetical protein
MNSLKSKNPLKRKISDIIDEIKDIIKSTINQKFWIESYGAYKLDAKYLVIWVCVEEDVTKTTLESDKDLLNTLKETLIKHNYPKDAIPFVSIGFESQETVNRESNGDWYMHFK